MSTHNIGFYEEMTKFIFQLQKPNPWLRKTGSKTDMMIMMMMMMTMMMMIKYHQIHTLSVPLITASLTNVCVTMTSLRQNGTNMQTNPSREGHSALLNSAGYDMGSAPLTVKVW